MNTSLPIEEVLPQVCEALRAGDVVLTAPPGSGKSTRVPLALLEQPWLGARRILMLEPRRLAARACAARMAELLCEDVGQTVGYRVRFDRRTSPRTRLEVLTEGLLTRRLQADPELAGVGIAIFDEFHERSLQADLAMALALDARSVLGLDLRILVMSATLETNRVAQMLGGATVISSRGRLFPVEIQYASRDADPPEVAVAVGVRAALAEGATGVLGFLPGGREIRAAAELLASAHARIHPLYGDLPAAQQDVALHAPAGALPKVVLATNIAQTSLTVEGVTAVVDGGRRRTAVYDLGAGADVLRTEWVSRATAAQRSGRAGRVQAGVAWRMWSREREAHLAAWDTPEILVADLSRFALELAAWGVRDVGSLRLLDAPPAVAWEAARELLQRLGALDAERRVTARGRRMLTLPVNPRTAAMLLDARSRGLAREAVWIAVLLDSRDAAGECDLGRRLADLRSRRSAVPRWMERSVRQIGRLLDTDVSLRAALDAEAAGRIVALGYPERVARRRSADRGVFVCADGREARLAGDGALAAMPWLAIAHWQPGSVRRIRLAASLDEAQLRRDHPGSFHEERRVRWDREQGAVIAECVRRFADIGLDHVPWPDAPADVVTKTLIDGIRDAGLAVLPWTPAARQWQARVLSLRRWHPHAAWADVTDEHLAATLEEWLAPALAGVTRLSQLRELNLRLLLGTLLDWRQARELARLAPERLAVPSGSGVPLRYSADGAPPRLAVKLQELFGLKTTPVVDEGRIKVVLELLSPARRPIQTTSDLASFWRNGYAEVRRELRGRYPKHPWPEDPMTAVPTRHARRGESRRTAPK
ncbi:MAG TPA: ATP-dependent helicase HrpB [Nevskiaceae bacterium]